MENKSTGKTVVIVILLLALLGLGGYVVYDKFINKETEKIKDEPKADEKAKVEDTGFNISNKSMIQVLDGYNYRLYISKDGEALLTVDDIESNTDQSIKNTIAKLKGQYAVNKLAGYCKVEGDAAKEVCPDGDAVKSIKLDVSNVVAAYDSKSGQEIGGSYIIFLKSDGTISRLNLAKLLYEGKLDIENNVGNLKNIVSVVQSASAGIQSGYYEILALEKDGSQHSLTDGEINN